MAKETSKDDFNNSELVINEDTVENGENSSQSFNETKNEVTDKDGENSDLKVSGGKEDEISNENLQKWTMPEGMSANCLEDFSKFFSNPTPFIVACVKSIIPILSFLFDIVFNNGAKM